MELEQQMREQMNAEKQNQYKHDLDRQMRELQRKRTEEKERKEREELKLEMKVKLDREKLLKEHLHMLEEAKAIKVNKSFAGVKPLTTIKLTANGRKNFLNYLTTLEEVLRQASTAMENGDIRKAKTI